MSLLDTLTLFAIMATLAAVPSSSVALVVIRSATLGFSHGAAVAVGIVLGDLVFVLLAVSGLVALAETMGSFFMVVRYLGGAYLIWLGVNLLRVRPANDIPVTSALGSGLAMSCLAGFLVTLGDVKAIFFYASLLPAFVDMAALRGSDIAAIIAVTVVTVAGVKLAYAAGAGKLRSLTLPPGIERRSKVAAGGFMMGIGAYFIVKT